MPTLHRRAAGGIVRGPLPENTTRTSILICMLTLAIYMCLLVAIKTFSTFKRRNTLYFYAILLTAAGITSHSTGIILKWFVGPCPWAVNTAFASFGWWGMVTGQSLVLYSRLHLVVRDDRILKAVLAMIIVNFTIFQVPTTILTFGSNQLNSSAAAPWLKVYNIYERIQLVIFTLQELLISTIYIRAAIALLSPSDPASTAQTKKFLIYLNVLCIALDIAFVCEVFSGEWVYKTGTQSLAYAIKLTIEFSVLNKLMEVYRLGPGACTACRRRFDDGSKANQILSGSGSGAGGAASGSASVGVRGSAYGMQRPGLSRQSASEEPTRSGGVASWVRSKSRNKGVMERLGPFHEEEMVEGRREGLERTGSRPGLAKREEDGIVVTSEYNIVRG